MDGFQMLEWQGQENDSGEAKAVDTTIHKNTSVGSDESVENASESNAVEDAVIDTCVDTGESEDNGRPQAEAKIGDDENASAILLRELNDKIDQMNQLFNQKILHTTHEEKIVDQMHAELQKYKDDMYAQLVRPILIDIIEIRESIRRVSGSFAMKPEEERFVPLKTFSDYTYDIQDVLEKNNIAIYDSKEGDDFNALKHRAIKKVTTPVEELHGKIAESLSSGYEYLGKTISPEKVVVYVYQKPENTEGEN